MKDKIINFLINWVLVVYITLALTLVLIGIGVMIYGIVSHKVIHTIVGFLILTFGISLILILFPT